MAGVPGLEHVERFAAAHLADDDSVGTQAEGRADEVGHCHRAGSGAKRDGVGRGRLQLARVLDQDHALVEMRHLGEQRIGERRLARARTARDEDVAAFDDRQRQKTGRVGRHDAVIHIIEQRVDAGRGLADRKAGRERHGRQHAFEPLARSFAMRRQLGRDDRRPGMDFGPAVTGDQADDPLDLRGIVADLSVGPPLTEPVEPQQAIGIDHHLDDQRVGERGGDGRSHRGAQHRAATARGDGIGNGVHDGAPAPAASPSVRVPAASCRPTCATNASKRSRPIARAALSESGSGAVTVSW